MDYKKLLSPTVMGIKPSGIRKFFDIANTMEDVISLGVGEPDFPTPWEIRKAGILSLEGGKTRYTSNRGLEVLREEIGNYVKRKYGVTYDPVSEILVTVGGSEAIDACIRAIASPGDEIIIPQPSYVCYEPITALCGCKPVIIETKAENSFKLTAKELKAAITPRTKALILPYPNNPTGGVMTREQLIAIAQELMDTDIIVISDEIYCCLVYDKQEFTSFASLGEEVKERTILIDGFSSPDTGRLGICPRDFFVKYTRVCTTIRICKSQYCSDGK